MHMNEEVLMLLTVSNQDYHHNRDPYKRKSFFEVNVL